MANQSSRGLLTALRPHQWSKNILVFVPLITAHKFLQLDLMGRDFLALLALSCCASSLYLFNDIIDLKADRLHPIKQNRPLAAGRLSPKTAKGLLFLGFLAGGSFSLLLTKNFMVLLGTYCAIGLFYSLYFKKIVVFDVIVLASLYTLRIFAGAAAIEVPISPWLLAFAMFFFLSLALVKRFSELYNLRIDASGYTMGRNYQESDLNLIANLGTSSGYVSILVMALYVNSEAVSKLYSHPQLLWFICPLLLYWISRIWLLAERGKIDEDPIVFAITDKTSYLIGFMIAAIVAIAI